MIRTQIYLTEQEHEELRTLAEVKGASQSELIREAVDCYLATYRTANRLELMRTARGIWADRDDLDVRSLRAELDRELDAP